MHIGPDPTEYGLVESGTGSSLPVVKLNAEMVLLVVVVFVVEWFSTYR